MTTGELLHAFNDWLDSNGHNPWTKETFLPRFLQHQESTKRGIERKLMRTKGRDVWRYKKRERGHTFASYYPDPKELKEREHCVIGVRLQRPFDKEEDPGTF